jgi:hypothetical protein
LHAVSETAIAINAIIATALLIVPPRPSGRYRGIERIQMFHHYDRITPREFLVNDTIVLRHAQQLGTTTCALVVVMYLLSAACMV